MFMDNLYNEAVEVGKIQTNVSLFLSMTIFFIILCVSIWFFYKTSKDNKNLSDVTAKILKSECKYYLTEKDGGRYSCNLNVTYEIDGKKYSGDIISNDIMQYKNGSNVTLLYNKLDPNIIEIKKTNNVINIILYLFLFIFLFGLVGSLYRYYMAHKYGFYSSVYGTGAAFGHGMRSTI